MPGMMGGMGGLFGGMGGGGMFGGAGGRNQSGTSGAPAEPASDVYDVDRWKRADDVDSVPLTHVQQVRDAWERKTEEKKSRSPLAKLKNLFSKRKDKASAAETAPTGGTVVMPEAKRASARIHASEPPPAVVSLPVEGECPFERVGKNYLGLSMVTELDDFFTASPLNSAILAVDSLSLGPLTLNQVLLPEPEMKHAPVPSREIPAETAAASVPTPRPPEDDAPLQLVPVQQASAVPAVGGRQNYIAQQSGTTYMNAIRESHEQKKYEVRIT